MCFLEIVHANFGTVGIAIHADECIHIAEIQLGRNVPSFLPESLGFRQMSWALKLL